MARAFQIIYWRSVITYLKDLLLIFFKIIATRLVIGLVLATERALWPALTAVSSRSSVRIPARSARIGISARSTV